LPAGAVEVLRQNRQVIARRTLPQSFGDLTQLLMRGEQDERPALDRLGNLRDGACHLPHEGRIVKLPQVGRQAQQRLGQVIEGR
jgi:hypothetical protein